MSKEMKDLKNIKYKSMLLSNSTYNNLSPRETNDVNNINDFLEKLNGPLRISISQSFSLNFNKFRGRAKPVNRTRLDPTAIEQMKPHTADERTPRLPEGKKGK